jgi:phage protein D
MKDGKHEGKGKREENASCASRPTPFRRQETLCVCAVVPLPSVALLTEKISPQKRKRKHEGKKTKERKRKKKKEEEESEKDAKGEGKRANQESVGGRQNHSLWRAPRLPSLYDADVSARAAPAAGVVGGVCEDERMR